MRVHLTEQKVQSFKPRDRRYDVLDALVPGLLVHVTPKGSKSLMLKTRYPGAKHPTRRAIGEVGRMSLEQARAQARDWLELISKGADPAIELAEKQRRARDEDQLTFAAVAELYIKQKLAGARQRERSTDEIRKELLPSWGARRI